MADPNDPNATPTAGPAPSGGVLSGSETQAFQAGFEQNPQAGGSIQDAHLEVILDVPVTLSMEVGRARISIRELLSLNPGSVVKLQSAIGEPMDILVNGCLVARGEVVVVGEQFGIRIADVVSPEERIKTLSCSRGHASTFLCRWRA